MDLALFRGINGLAGFWPPLDLLMVGIADVLPWFYLGVLAWLWFGPAGPRERQERRVTAVLALVAVLLALGLTQLPGFFYYRLRPYMALRNVTVLVTEKPANSFPSVHLGAASGMAGALPYRSAWAGWGMWALTWAMAYARVFIGVHYPVDVLTGLVLGWLAGVTVRSNRDVLTAFAERIVGAIRDLV